MKILLRIYYAFMVGVLFLFSLYKSLEIRDEKYNNKYGQLALEKTGDDKYLFFYEILGFHQNKPVYKIENQTYSVWFFEIVRASVSKDDYIVNSFLYPVISSTDEAFGQKGKYYVLNFKTEKEGDDSVIPYFVVKHKSLNIANIQTEDGDYYISYSDLVGKDVYQMELLIVDEKDSLNQEVLLEEELTIIEENFYIKTQFEELFYNKKSANEPLKYNSEDRTFFENTLQILSKASHNPKEYNYIVYLWMGSYLVVFLVATYFVFFYRKKGSKLGGKRPSEALIKSIKKNK